MTRSEFLCLFPAALLTFLGIGRTSKAEALSVGTDVGTGFSQAWPQAWRYDMDRKKWVKANSSAAVSDIEPLSISLDSAGGLSMSYTRSWVK